jgi:hypothetical protein
MHRRANSRTFLVLALLLVLPLVEQISKTAPRFGDWSAPANLGPVINTQFGEFAAQVSKDGLSLYFASTRPAEFGSFGGEDLWVSRRSSEAGPWDTPANLGAMINTASNDRSPAFSRDGHYLFFASDRPGGFGALDIWVSYREHTNDDLGWGPPVNLGAAVNTAATDAGPSFLENEDFGIPLLFLASNRLGGTGGLDLYVSELLGQFQPPTLLSGLNTAQADLTPGIRHDGLELFFATARPGGSGAQDLWVSTRSAVTDQWEAPVNLGIAVNSTASDNFPSVSSDRTALFFNSDRNGGFGGSDLYVTRRAGPER